MQIIKLMWNKIKKSEKVDIEKNNVIDLKQNMTKKELKNKKTRKKVL